MRHFAPSSGLCTCWNAPVLLFLLCFLLLPPQPNELQSRKMKWLIQVGFLGVNLERQAWGKWTQNTTQASTEEEASPWLDPPPITRSSAIMHAKAHWHHREQPHPSQPLPVPLLPYSSPEVKFGWIQVCLLCLGLSSCSLSSDIPCPALHWPWTCAAQRPGTAFIQGPHSASCSTPSPLLSVKDYQYIYNKYGPTLVCGDFLQNPGFWVCYHIRGVILQTRGWIWGYSYCLFWKRKPCCLLSCETGNFCSGSSVVFIQISNLWILYRLIKRKLLIIERKFKPWNYFFTVFYLFANLTHMPDRCLPATQQPRSL